MSTLPVGFEMLEPYVAHWAVDGSANRSLARANSTTEQRRDFYNVMQPIADAALALLDSKSLAEHDAAEKNLMNLCLSLAHVAMAVEAQGDDEAKHAPHREQMIITRTVADF
jgi:hypothetical protein